MKNREKYRDEILENSKKISEEARVSACEFINRIVLPTFGDGVSCLTLNCAWCKFLLGIWLDEEYIEPPKPEVDWDNVPVDTLVRVSDDKNEPGRLMYFCRYRPDNIYKFETWKNGTTSKTADDTQICLFCELVEDEDE